MGFLIPSVTYDSDEFLVQHIFGGRLVFVKHKRSGKRAVARKALTARCATLIRLAPAFWQNDTERDAILKYILDRFCLTALQPNALGSQLYIQQPPERIIGLALDVLRGNLPPELLLD